MQNKSNIELTRENVLALILSGMEQKSMSVSSLEREANISKDSVRDFIRGKTYIPRADKLQKILLVLYPNENYFG